MGDKATCSKGLIARKHQQAHSMIAVISVCLFSLVLVIIRLHTEAINKYFVSVFFTVMIGIVGARSATPDP